MRSSLLPDGLGLIGGGILEEAAGNEGDPVSSSLSFCMDGCFCLKGKCLSSDNRGE